jgi:protein O-GlcNAc transferase
MINVKQLMETATQALYRNDFGQAESSCRQILMISSDNPEALHLLGIICGQQGKLVEAANHIEKAIKSDPKNHLYYSNLGEMLRRQGKLEEAADTFRKAVNLNPDFAGTRYNLANTLKAQGKYAEAIQYYSQAIQLDPGDSQSLYNLGNTLMEVGEFQSAINTYQEALRIDPNLYDAHYNMGRAFQELNQWEEAIYHNKQSVKIKPDFPEAHRALGIIHETRSQVEEAIKYYQNLLLLEPDNIPLQLHLETISPLINLSNPEITRYREHLLNTIKRYVPQNMKIDLQKIYENIHPSSTLIYQGRDDCRLKKDYAEIFKNSFEPVNLPPQNNSKPHVGFVVTHGHEGIFIKCMKGIINNLPADDFNITVICDNLAGIKKVRPEITSPAVSLLNLPKYFAEMVEVIKNAACDILYFWEVGTDSTNYFLPFFRLAPVQCTGWGWPVTTGIPRMDYFISSELLETENSDALYSETLVRLKSLPPYYYRPVIPKDLKPRSYFGFSETDHLYFCMQNLRKVHPDYDKVIGDILRNDPDGIVVFTQDKHANVSGMVKTRLQVSQADVSDRIRFLNRIPSDAEYLNFLALTDVVLDTMYYSGTNTTYEAFAAGVPVVTLPGPSIRGRYTYGTYKVIGIDDCIAGDEEEYVSIAVKIASDREYRKQLSSRILETSGILFEDMNAVKELGDFFKKVTGKKIN